MFFDKYKDDSVWSARTELTYKERRVLTWRYSNNQRAADFTAALFCVGFVVALIVLGLKGPGAALGTLIFVAMIDIFIVVVLTMRVFATEDKMRGSSTFRFADMQHGAPAFDLAVRYCMLANGTLVTPSGRDWLADGLSTGSPELDDQVTALLVASWDDDRRAVTARRQTRRAKLLLQATERAIERFKAITHDAPEGFVEYCEAVLEQARQQYRAALAQKLERLRKQARQEIARAQGEVAKTEHRLAELDGHRVQSDVVS